MARKLSPHQRLAIVACIGTGLNDSEIARQLKTTRQAVARLRDSLKAYLPVTFDAAAAKQRIVIKAYWGLEAGLSDPSNNYKRAGLSVHALKGFGEMQSENNAQQANIYADWTRDLPADWFGKYISTDDQPPRRQIGGKTRRVK